MYVKEILQFHPEDKEADIIISDGVYSVVCYACPVDYLKIGCKVSKLYAHNCGELSKVHDGDYSITKLSDYYAYSIIAKVSSWRKRVVQVGGLLINLDEPIPNDICEEEFVIFEVLRLDCIC